MPRHGCKLTCCWAVRFPLFLASFSCVALYFPDHRFGLDTKRGQTHERRPPFGSLPRHSAPAGFSVGEASGVRRRRPSARRSPTWGPPAPATPRSLSRTHRLFRHCTPCLVITCCDLSQGPYRRNTRWLACGGLAQPHQKMLRRTAVFTSVSSEASRPLCVCLQGLQTHWPSHPRGPHSAPVSVALLVRAAWRPRSSLLLVAAHCKDRACFLPLCVLPRAGSKSGSEPRSDFQPEAKHTYTHTHTKMLQAKLGDEPLLPLRPSPTPKPQLLEAPAAAGERLRPAVPLLPSARCCPFRDRDVGQFDIRQGTAQSGRPWWIYVIMRSLQSWFSAITRPKLKCDDTGSDKQSNARTRTS